MARARFPSRLGLAGAAAFALGNGEVNDVVAQKFGVRKGYKYIISVGSVGQPRDYDNRACFVVCDTDARTVEYVR
ncbi:MAG TPA: hypothetical protein VIG99_09545, partial [Myxococcaceae bacterium]